MKKWNEPSLLVDDHHGQFMMQMLFKEGLDSRYLKQAKKQIGNEAYQAVLDGPDNESHFDACDEVTNCIFKTPTGQKFTIQYAEGGIWAIPYCFKNTEEFFGS